MDFPCACLAEHLNDFPAGRAAHQRVIHQNNTPAFNQIAHGIEFDLDAKVADGLRWFDKGTANVVVAHQSKPEVDARLRCVANSGCYTGIRDGNNNIRLDRMLSGQLLAHFVAAFIDTASIDTAIWARKIHMLENTESRRLRREGMFCL